MVLGLLAWIMDMSKLRSSQIDRKASLEKNCSLPFFNLLENFVSKMMFLNSKKSFLSLGSEFSLGMDLEVFRHFLFYRFKTNQRC
jgi:hypothetical protein